MFGAISTKGQVLESEASVEATLELRSPSTEQLAHRIVEAGRVVQEMGEGAW